MRGRARPRWPQLSRASSPAGAPRSRPQHSHAQRQAQMHQPPTRHSAGLRRRTVQSPHSRSHQPHARERRFGTNATLSSAAGPTRARCAGYLPKEQYRAVQAPAENAASRPPVSSPRVGVAAQSTCSRRRSQGQPPPAASGRAAARSRRHDEVDPPDRRRHRRRLACGSSDRPSTTASSGDQVLTISLLSIPSR